MDKNNLTKQPKQNNPNKLVVNEVSWQCSDWRIWALRREKGSKELELGTGQRVWVRVRERNEGLQSEGLRESFYLLLSFSHFRSPKGTSTVAC